MDEIEQMFEYHDRQNIHSLVKDKIFFEDLRTRLIFSDRSDFWDETIALLETVIKIEKDSYEQRYNVKFEEAGPLLANLEKHLTEPGKRTGNANQIFD